MKTEVTDSIFPAYAGLNLKRRFVKFVAMSFPRIRGVEPGLWVPYRVPFSSRMRGYFQTKNRRPVRHSGWAAVV